MREAPSRVTDTHFTSPLPSDIRVSQAVMEIMEARVKKASELGCDAVEPDNMDVSDIYLHVSPPPLPPSSSSPRS